MSYAPPSERPPLLPYAALMGVFGALFGACLLVAMRTERQLPNRIGSGRGELEESSRAEEKGLG